MFTKRFTLNMLERVAGTVLAAAAGYVATAEDVTSLDWRALLSAALVAGAVTLVKVLASTNVGDSENGSVVE